MKGIKRRLFSFAFSLAMVLCLLPAMSMSVNAETSTISLTVSEGVSCLDSQSPILIDNVEVMNGQATVGHEGNHDIQFQVAFGSAVSKVFVNDTEYGITASEGGKIQVTVPHADSYDVKLVAGQSEDITIMWSYDPEDADRDFYVDHGKVEVLSITRGGTVIYDGKTPSEDVRIDENGGWVALKLHDDVVLKLIPDYGYQLESVTINDQTLTPQEDVSVFSLPDIQGNLHFKGVFVEKPDQITNSSDIVSNIRIANGQNAVSTGNLSLAVSDNAGYSTDVLPVVNGEATKVTSLDLSLDHVVSKGTDASVETGWWRTNLTEFEKPIQVGLTLDSTALAAGETYSVVRDHNGVLTELENVTYNASTGALLFETNQFSTYTIVKKAARETHNSGSDNTVYIVCEACGHHNWTPYLEGYKCDNCGHLRGTTGVPAEATAATATTKRSPKTGDIGNSNSNNMVVYVSVVLLSAASLVGYMVYNRKHSK